MAVECMAYFFIKANNINIFLAQKVLNAVPLIQTTSVVNFCKCTSCFCLLGINTYGWRQAGVNHVLIFELNPRNNLSHQHLFEVCTHLCTDD